MIGTLFNLVGRKLDVDKNNALRAEIGKVSSTVGNMLNEVQDIGTNKEKLARQLKLKSMLTTGGVGLAGLGGAKVLSDNMQKQDIPYNPQLPIQNYSYMGDNTANFFLIEAGIAGLVGLEGLAARARTKWVQSGLNRKLNGLKAQQLDAATQLGETAKDMENMRTVAGRNTLRNSAIAGAGALAIGTPTMTYMNNKYSNEQQA